MKFLQLHSILPGERYGDVAVNKVLLTDGTDLPKGNAQDDTDVFQGTPGKWPVLR